LPFLIYSVVFYLRQIKWMWFICEFVHGFSEDTSTWNYAGW
jgi:hypothetical protein